MDRAPASLGLRLLLAALCLALGLLGAEALVRLYAELGGKPGERLAERDPLATLVVPHGEHGYRQRPNTRHRYPDGTVATSNALGYRGPLVPLEKPPGTFRVLLLGGSTTHGFRVNDAETIDAHMRALLAERYPHRRFDVVNLALDGYDSYQLFERMRSDGVRFAPDLVIVNSGINDVRNARFPDLRNPDPRTLIWEGPMARMREEQRRGGPTLWTWIKHYTYLARVPGYLREAYQDRERGRKQTEKKPERTEPPQPSRAALDYFETNLRRIATLVADEGADLVLSTAPSALATRYAPDDTSTLDYWIVDAQTTAAYRQQLAGRMERVARDLAASGRRVPHLTHDLPPDLFLDDCHLTGAGNRALAARFVEAATPFIEASPGRPD